MGVRTLCVRTLCGTLCGYAPALRELYFDVSSILRLRVMAKRGGCIQIQVKDVGSNDFTNAADQVPVKRELAANKDCLQPFGRYR